MNSGPDLRIGRSLDLLGSLKQTCFEFAKKEEQLTRDLNVRRHAANRKYREAMDKVETRLADLIAETNAGLEGEEERVAAIYAARRKRVERVASSGLRNLPRRARETKERWLGDLQMKSFQAERKFESDMKAAGARFATFSADLAVQRDALFTLTRRARSAFAGSSAFGGALRQGHTASPQGADAQNPDVLLDNLRVQLAAAEEQLTAFQKAPMAKVFRGLTAPKAAATATASALSEAAWLHDACTTAAQARHNQERQILQENFEATRAAIVEQWNRADEVEADFESRSRTKIETQAPRILAKIHTVIGPRLTAVTAGRAGRIGHLQGDADARKSQFTETHDAEMAALAEEEKSRWSELESSWKSAITPIYEAIGAMNDTLATRFPAWNARYAETWKPPTELMAAAKFAHLDLDLTRQPESAPRDARLALPGSPQVSIPLALTFPDHGSLLFETTESGGGTVLDTLDNIILRLLSTTPPGKMAFTIIDPVGLGQGFAGLMHLADYEESLINRRIWTQREQIEERLAELSEHIEKVIQMYLRNEYATITEYNAQAGSVAEKYHFLVVADFPANFGETAAKRLQSIAASGPRCGIFTLIHWDQRHPLPDGFSPDELRKSSICVRRKNGAFVLDKAQTEAGAELIFDAPPEPELAVTLIHKIGKSSIDSNRVQVPFAQIAPAPGELWTNDTTHELKIAVGRTGATKHQFLAIGKGTRQHALFAGKTGSGKSTLFHVIITNLALACSPDQVEFYLIDFKKGVEFKCYASKRLPHARVIAIESDREFALSVLQRVDEELKRRGDMFRKLGVQDIAGYKKAGGTEPMPRSLLMIDEFQEFFVEDDTIAQTASLLFDRIVRQGRAFGIHVLLGSQSLGGAYSLARATLGQMVIRVALQCNEAVAYLIMDDSNSAPRLLSRPGEGIYNDAGGAVEGNSPFQVVWLPDDERDAWLDKVSELAMQHHDHHPSPIVFEGNAPSDIRENDLLHAVTTHPSTTAPAAARAWLGAPNSIKGPTEAVFQRQSGNHLLVVGQRDEASLTMLGLSMLALGAQYPPGTAKFVLIQSTTPGSSDADLLDRIVAAIPHEVTATRGPEIPQIINDLATELKARTSGEAGPNPGPVFIFIHGLHRFKKLRHEDDFSFSSGDNDEAANTGAQFQEIITEGSSQGLHLLVSVDTFNNVNRAMSRKALTEFEMRVVFQMSANDSASLTDSPKASALGLHRALFYNEQAGTLETFRPYAAPDRTWLTAAAEKLSRSAPDLAGEPTG